MKVNKLMQLFCLLALTVLSVGCANLQTINRSTSINSYDDDSQGKAIHLDANQRLVVFNRFQQYCAEPSPDAMAAYASSLGLGLSKPTGDAASISQSAQTSIANIGLRTQSITLMRDGLYRMCEAHMNNAINATQVATFLQRSQDLTAVIVAIEQLTGAVAARQSILTGTTSAAVSASLVTNQESLDAARKDEADKIKSVEEATTASTEAESVFNQRKTEELALVTKIANPAPGDDVPALETELANKKAELNLAEQTWIAEKALVDSRQKLADEATKNRETIENIRDSAITSAIASTTSSGSWAAPVQQKVLSKDATTAIAESVENMVIFVLKKRYSQESCMAILSSQPEGYANWEEAQKSGYKKVLDLCIKLVGNSLAAEIDEYRAVYAPDQTTDLINDAIDTDQSLRSKINKWLKSESVVVSLTSILNGSEYSNLRKAIANEFNLQ